MIEVGEPDVVVEPRRLPGDLVRIQPDGPSDVLVAVVAVTKPADLDAGLARHQRGAFEHRVPRQQHQSVWTDRLHVPGHIEHQLQVVIFGHARAPVEIPVLGGERAPALLGILVVADRGGIDHEIGILQTRLSVQRLLELEVRPQVLGVPEGQLMDHVEALFVDVHEAHLAAVQALGQTHVLDQAQGKHDTARAEDRYLDWHGRSSYGGFWMERGSQLGSVRKITHRSGKSTLN